MTKTLDSTAVYAYTTLISMIVCLPFAIGMEGGALQAGAAAAIAKVCTAAKGSLTLYAKKGRGCGVLFGKMLTTAACGSGVCVIIACIYVQTVHTSPFVFTTAAAAAGR